MSEVVASLMPEFERLRRRFPEGFDSSMTLPCLRRVQEVRGHVADEDIAALVAWLGVPRIQFEEVLSYYTQFRRQPVGQVRLEICRNVSCSMRGAERLLGHVCRRLGVAEGGTTSNGRFTVTTAECLGSCGTAPVMVVDDEYHENMDVDKADRLIDAMSGPDGGGRG
jgi:NADH-quinone oxidoreductase subunit E